MLGRNDTDRARDALNAIPADLPRDQWVKAGMAAHAAGLSLDDFDTWSASAPSYNAQAARATFRSFKTSPGGVGGGALYGMARDHGWSDGSTGPRTAPTRAIAKPKEEPLKPRPGMGAEEVWKRCEAATNAHPYIQQKKAAGVPLDGLRVVPAGDTLRIAGESMAGALVVPVLRTDGMLSSLQFITTPAVTERLKAKGNPGKLNLPKHPVEGGFTVGTIAPGAVVYIVEGVGQAWACWQATGAAAVACFGAGNMAKVAQTLRQQDPDAHLVVVPDVGKEAEALAIAKDVEGLIAVMPDGWTKNSDVNDLAQRDGMDVLEMLLREAVNPPKPVPKVHPLARYVDIDGTAKPPRWVIPGFIGHGVTVIAGAHGVGKTTALLPLAMTAAGLHGDDLMPRHWRHVVYVTEDVEQVRRILAGITGYANLAINLESVRERVHIVEAVRLDPAFVASVGGTYREQFTRTIDGVEVLPLVVLDTKSAVLAIENENDNAEASAMMAALKQGFEGLPVWLIGHVAKQNIGRADLTGLSSRGASAIEGDANQTVFLIREDENRYLIQGKTRFESRWPELEITSFTAQTTAPDEFGNLETLILRWGVASPAQQSRKEASVQAVEHRRKEDAARLRQEVRDAIETAWQTGYPLNRTAVKAKVRRNAADVTAMIENLLSERWLYEVSVPAKIRTVSSKASFLVNLTTEEHEAVMRGDGPPSAKIVIPRSWQKQEIPPVPAPERAIVEPDHGQEQIAPVPVSPVP